MDFRYRIDGSSAGEVATTHAADWRAALRRHRRWLLAAALVLATGLLAAPRLLRGPTVPVLAVGEAPLVQTVVATGRVQTPHRVSIGAQIVGTVRRVDVLEGQAVQARQPLFSLESDEWQAAVRQADAAVLQARLRLRQLEEVQAPVAEEALREAVATRNNARAQADRNDQLLRQNFVGPAAMDESRKALDIAEAQLRSAERLFASSRPGGSDHALALSALAQAQAAAAAAHARLAYATVSAPVAGTLLSVDVAPGDVVQPGKVLMSLSPDGPTELVVQIDERNLSRLAIGQSALGSADAFASERFAARVVYIGPAVDPQRGSVEVRLAVPAPPAHLRQDMTVSVDIEVARLDAAVLVPVDGVHELDGERPWALVIEGGRLQRRNLVLGARAAAVVQVLEGLRPGDAVAPVDWVAGHDGMRVRARADASSPR